MNNNLKADNCKCFISSGAVSLLVLVSEWSKLKEDAYKKVDVILLLLCGIYRLSKDKELPIEVIYQELSVDDDLRKKYMYRIREISNDVSKVIDLFDAFIEQCGSTGESLIFDGSLKNSVLEMFVRRSILEYQRLTFFQLCVLHENLVSSWKVSTPSLSSAMSLADNDVSCVIQKVVVSRVPTIPECGMDTNETPQKLLDVAALRLAQIHGKFGHRKEGLLALQESIRMAQQRNNSVVLEYALGWLIKLQPGKVDDIIAVLKRFVQNARQFDLPTLEMWGQLQEVKEMVCNGLNIKQAVAMLMSPEVSLRYSYNDRASKLFQRSLLLALQESIFDQCGLKLCGLFYTQLFYQMPMESVSQYCQEWEESSASPFLCIARYLYKNEKFNKCLNLLAAAIDLSSSVQFKMVLSQCMEEMNFDNAIGTDNITDAKQHFANIDLFNSNSTKYKSAGQLSSLKRMSLS